MKILALIDGEHYPAVNAAAIEHLKQTNEVLGVVFIGGTEKMDSIRELEILGLPIFSEESPIRGIEKGIDTLAPELIYDLSDEPVISYRDRFEFASLILSKDVAYRGSDFQFTPQQFSDVSQKPGISIVGTGKRIGKTAIGSYVGRLLKGKKINNLTLDPCIVTMGRGGPSNPEVLKRNGKGITAEFLLEEAKAGKHAASDHYEDALFSGLTTIGCRRCGGGFAGAVYCSNIVKGAEEANNLPNNFVIFEGSGASIPPILTEGWILTMGAYQPIETMTGYMSSYRIRKSDIVILTMCEEHMLSIVKSREIENYIRRINPYADIARTVFRPRPQTSIKGKKVLYATTASESVGDILKDYLEETYECEVVGITHRLSNRKELVAEINDIVKKNPGIDVLLTELKAASIDVAANICHELMDIVFCDNELIQLDGDFDLDRMIIDVADLAIERFRERNP